MGSKYYKVNNPAISVVIPTFNRAESLQSTLQSLADQSLSKDDYEVIVVNDGASDSTPEICSRFTGRMQLVALRHVENSGISAAKNTGILAARGRILLFADDDDVADRHLLKEHIKAHEQYAEENVAVLGYTTWARSVPVTLLMKYLTDVGRFLFAYGELSNGQTLDFTYFWGGRSSCKRSFLVKHGVFNRQFRSIIEDMELGYRLSRFGLRVVFHRAAVSYMTRPLSFEEFCQRCERQGEAFYLFSRLHSDPVVQQYCRLPDPFIGNRAVGVDPEARWPEIAALFGEKIDEAINIEQLLRWGFEPEPAETGTVKRLAEAEAYENQMRELFAALRESTRRAGELERQLSEQEASYQAELKSRQARYKAEEEQLREDLAEARRVLGRTKERHAAEQNKLREHLVQANRVFDERLAEANRVLARAEERNA